MDQLIQLVKSKKEEHILEHGGRVADLAAQLARESKSVIDENSLLLASKFHDIGKIFVPGSILNKPSRLLDFEFQIIQMHPIYSYKILKNHDLDENLLQMSLYHHENFDGSGYNYKLKGKEIPLGARIIRICDTFDALTSDRPYRMKLTYVEAIEIMESDQSKYDPDLYSKFKEFVLKLSTNKKDRRVI